eukprot:2234690-Pyramimonas_sp.AAC.1
MQSGLVKALEQVRVQHTLLNNSFQACFDFSLSGFSILRAFTLLLSIRRARPPGCRCGSKYPKG